MPNPDIIHKGKFKSYSEEDSSDEDSNELDDDTQ